MNEYGEVFGWWDGMVFHTSHFVPRTWTHPYSGPPPEGWQIEPNAWNDRYRWRCEKCGVTVVGILPSDELHVCEEKPRTFTLTVPKWWDTNGAKKRCNIGCPLLVGGRNGKYDPCALGFAKLGAYPDPAKCPGSPDHDVEIECTVKG